MYYTRISFNSSGWRHPTGEAAEFEAKGSYNQQYKFGHEDWLFRSEWTLGGWRYAYLQGVNKSYDRLCEEQETFDILLYTITPAKQRRFVALLRGVECLAEAEAVNALQAYRELGWYDTMVQEVAAIGGDPSGLGAPKYVNHVLNIRFRQEHVALLPDNTFATPEMASLLNSRYQLYKIETSSAPQKSKAKPTKPGSTDLPKVQAHIRTILQTLYVEPEHAAMQAKLMQALQQEYPQYPPRREVDCIDVVVETDSEKILFEIKSHLEPRTVIRHALGQILEYAYHPSRQHDKTLRLVIVGRQELAREEKAYLELLRTLFQLPVEYRVVSI
jgi:hypothetical protein